MKLCCKLLIVGELFKVKADQVCEAVEFRRRVRKIESCSVKGAHSNKRQGRR
jgi:hypothetical protein